VTEPEAEEDATEDVYVPSVGNGLAKKYDASPPSVLAAGVKGGSLLFFKNEDGVNTTPAPALPLFPLVCSTGNPIVDVTGVLAVEDGTLTRATEF
jgi:hypothetical protein